MADENLELSKETTLQAYASFFSAFFHLKGLVDTTKQDWSKVKLAALTMAAFSIEAYANHVGQHLFKSWDKIERGMSPIGKLRLFCEHLKLSIQYEAVPFQTVADLIKWRNKVAHGTTVTVTSKQVVPISEVDRLNREFEESDWESYVKRIDLDRIENDCREFMILLHKEALGHTKFLFVSGWQSTSAYRIVSTDGSP